MASGAQNEDDKFLAQFEEVALPFMDALYSKAFHLTRNPEEARDLVQETYLRAYRTFSNFTLGTNCRAWLFTILYSIFINNYRKGQREPDTVSIDELEETFHRTLADPNWEIGFAALAESELNWQGPEVAQALGRLPESFRSVVLLVDVEGLNYEEAAGVLNCPVGTVRSRLYRARKILFLELRGYAQKMGFIRDQHA
jgi:RNA polymerase sigma-70 factor (ECF subfamily)